MKPSILSDEIDQDLAVAAKRAAEWGLEHVELRGFRGKRAPKGVGPREVEEILEAAATHGVTVGSISPGLFKVTPDARDIDDHRGDLQTRCLDLAEALGVTMMVVFPPVRSNGEGFEDYPDEVITDFRELAKRAADRGITVAVENEPICYAATGESLARFLDQVDHPALRANWDPGNAVNADEQPFPAGYEHIKPFLVHVHVKDYLRQPDGRGQCVPAGEGAVDWPGQLAALKADGYEGFLVVETHFKPPVEGSRRAVRALRELMGRLA